MKTPTATKIWDCMGEYLKGYTVLKIKDELLDKIIDETPKDVFPPQLLVSGGKKSYELLGIYTVKQRSII